MKLEIVIYYTREDTLDDILRKLDNIKDCIMKGITTSERKFEGEVIKESE